VVKFQQTERTIRKWVCFAFTYSRRVLPPLQSIILRSGLLAKKTGKIRKQFDQPGAHHPAGEELGPAGASAQKGTVMIYHPAQSQGDSGIYG
jgi:hypothetical protein